MATAFSRLLTVSTFSSVFTPHWSCHPTSCTCFSASGEKAGLLATLQFLPGLMPCKGMLNKRL